MRMILNVVLPPEPFNQYVRDGSAGRLIREILEATRPEAAYFTAQDGCRAGILVVEVAKASDIPALAEPWLLKFEADIELRPCMTPEDLGAAGLDALGAKWK